MGIFDKILKALGGPIAGFVDSIGGLIDGLSTTEEEKLAAKAQLVSLQQQFLIEMAAKEAEIITEQATIIRAEATGHSWLQRNWRPLVMMLFAYIVAHNYVLAPVFGIPFAEMPADLWTLLKIGIGGYVFGRSGEKMMYIWKNGNNGKSP